MSPWACGAAVAQGTHNPLVVGSNPSGPIFLYKEPKRLFFYNLSGRFECVFVGVTVFERTLHECTVKMRNWLYPPVCLNISVL